MRTKTYTIILLAAVVAAAGLPAGNAQLSTTATVGNLVPTIQDVAVPASVDPTAGTTTSVPVTITVADSNGYQDIVAVDVTVYKPDGSTVHVPTGSAASNGDGSGVAETFAFAFDMAHYDAPATGNDTYKVRAAAEDATGALSASFEATFSYTELVAMSLDAGELAFGALEPGQRSSVSTLTVTNEGNTFIDLDTQGTDLSDGEGHAIGVERIKYDLANSNMSSEQSLTPTTFTNTGFDLAYGPAASQSTWWQLDTPSGEEQYLPSGSYSGSVTLSAVQG